MAISALNSAATGLRALSTRIDVVANNLANAETLAFKRSRVNFEDLIYTTVKQPGTQTANGDISPAGIQVGHGVAISNTQLDLEQGPLEMTNRDKDVAIVGPGFFRVETLAGEAFTRNGNFFVNDDNELVLGMRDGYRLVPPVQFSGLPVEGSVSISTDGTVTAKYTEEGATEVAGQIQLDRFVNPQGLKLLGGSLYVPTEASGPPTSENPGANGTGELRQNFLEGSNVDPTVELVTLIKTQRAFELNSQSIQTADQALQTVANLRRF